jgi:type I restriction enzyme R subunit
VKNVAPTSWRTFEARQEVFTGKAMVVAMSRDICVHLYDEIVALRPDWHSADPEQRRHQDRDDRLAQRQGPAAPAHLQHQVKKRLEKRFKDPADPLRLVIVRDMWLTGFDAPCVHTMYIDKPMKGHNLMQAIARVNRVFKDKQGGLVVDYIGIATAPRS